MPGGNKNIKSKDGTPFESGNKVAEKWTLDEATKLGNDLIEWLRAKDEDGEDLGNMLFEEFLIIEKDLYPELIAYLSHKFSAFLNLIEKAKKIQEIKLHKYGLADRLNASITKFSLINNHGWVDKHEIKQEIKQEINVPTIKWVE